MKVSNLRQYKDRVVCLIALNDGGYCWVADEQTGKEFEVHESELTML